MDSFGSDKMNRHQIEQHLKAAVDEITPNILDRIDLSTPQEPAPISGNSYSTADAVWNRKARQFAFAMAACLCVLVMGGGMAGYQYQNKKIDSVIGIDVNPSVELSINRKNRVLGAMALNEEAQTIIADMDLKGVDLNVAVNAVIGSMVTHGYLDDLDNAILVTVSNDSIKKATELRASVVGDIEKTLEENQVQAVVYDQQVIEQDEMKLLAETYGISYGKAYFLKELIEQNKELNLDDMEELASMSMEEIAERITDNSFALGDFAKQVEETTKATEPQTEATTAETSVVETTLETTDTQPAATEEKTTVPATQPESTTTAPTTTSETTQAEVEKGRVEIDYVDYEDGRVYVYFVTRVRWKNPTVSIRDEDGNSYAAMVDETSGSECVILADGLEGGLTYTFVLGGLTPNEGGNATTVQGYFDKPEIASEATTEAAESGKEENEEESKEEIPTTEAPLPPEESGEVVTEATTEQQTSESVKESE